MEKQDVYKMIIRKERDLKQIAKLATSSPEIINYLITGISEEDARIKYGCSNTLVIIGEKNPELLYPHFDIFKGFIYSKNKFIKWAAILIVANLTKSDKEKKIDDIIDFYFSEITGPIMITAANIIKGAAIIAKAKPYLTERITDELLKIKSAKYQTEECHNIVLGHMISSFDSFFKQVKNKTGVINLVKKQINNPRKATKNKAEKFIKKWEELSSE
jgi:hypothetical protein